MQNMRKVLSRARFTTDATALQLNYDGINRSIMIGRKGKGCDGYIGRACEISKGKNIFDSSVWFNSGFPSIIGVFGMRGTGKSFNLGIFAECLAGSQQVSSGESLSSSTVIFDVQNQFWTLAIEPDSEKDKDHMEMLMKWNLSKEAIANVYCWSSAGVNSLVPGARTYTIAPSQLDPSDWLALLEQERYSPVGQALLTLLRHSTDHTPKTLATRAKPVGVLSSFQPATVEALRWRLESIADTDLIGDPGIDIREFLVPGRTSIILLRNLKDSLRSLTVASLVRLLAEQMTTFHQKHKLAYRGKGKQPEENLPKQLWIMMDEAHVIAPREGKTSANEPLIDYVKRGRDSGLSLIFATQQPSAVDDKLMSQVDMTFTQALGFDADVHAAVARMPTRKPPSYRCGADSLTTPGDLIRSLNPGEAVLADSANPRPFIISMRPRLSVHGGNTPT